MMIVVAIIGILAAIALPAYRDYTVRSKVTEVILATSGAKVGISEFVTNYGALPTAVSFVPEPLSSKYVSKVTWDGQLVTALAQGESHITGSTITLTPALAPFGPSRAAANQVTW